VSVPPAPPLPEEEGAGETIASRFDLYARAGGIATPLITTIFAFFIGGLVVLLITHKNPIATYKAIFNGSGLNWFFPWISHAERVTAGYNLQSTLLLTTPLILTGLAVALAFRAGLFNIGGQGQYAAGSIVAVWVASSFTGMSGIPHIVLAIVLGSLAGGAVAGIAGILRATVGSHEVITTIMLNWIIFWLAGYLFGQQGPLQTSRERSLTQSNDIVANTHLHVFWGNPILQGLHVGFFIAIAMLFVYWVILNRTTFGYEIRAVGYNPEAARYAGINVARVYFLSMAISGMFAGLAGVLDVLGWKFVLSVDDLQGQAGAGAVGFLGIAVALLGRNSAVGIFFSALLFGALLNGTSDRHLDPAVFPPTLAENLTLLIQGLVLLFIGADILVMYAWQARRRLVPRRLRASPR
jgi:simple sugar transport system permease protein